MITLYQILFGMTFSQPKLNRNNGNVKVIVYYITFNNIVWNQFHPGHQVYIMIAVYGNCMCKRIYTNGEGTVDESLNSVC